VSSAYRDSFGARTSARPKPVKRFLTPSRKFFTHDMRSGSIEPARSFTPEKALQARKNAARENPS
jgi:hypothetical protein